MVDIPPISQSNTAKVNLISDVTTSWKAGQILNGTTQQGGDALSNVLIRIGKQIIEAKTPITLKDGQEVKLLVKTSFDNSIISQPIKLPVLTILNTTPPSENISFANIKLRQFIASQQSFNQIQTLASTLTKNINDNTNKQTSAIFKTQLENLQNTLQVKSTGINANELKQKILNSGIFFESKINQQSDLKNSYNNLSNDFKYQLLSIRSELSKLIPENKINDIFNQFKTLINQENSPLRNTQLTFIINKIISSLPQNSLLQFNNLFNSTDENTVSTDEIQIFEKIISFNQSQQTTPRLQEQIKYQLMLLELGQQTEQAIRKITSLQLQPMSRDSDNMLLLFFNLVFKDNNEHFDMQYRIQEFNDSENNKKQNNINSWSVILDFNFKTLGKVQSKITLNDDHISTVFNTQYKATADKIKNLLPLLKTSLINCGLSINCLNVENTLTDKSSQMTHINNLLDEKV